MGDLFRIRTDRMELAWGEPRGSAPAPLAGATPPPARLVVTPRRAGAVPEVTAADPRLFEQTDYRVVVRATDGGRVRLAHRDPVLVGEIAEEDGGRLALGYVNFGSQVGSSEFTVLVDGAPELDVEVEVFPTKLDYATDYEHLVAEVQEILTGLAVEYLRSTFRLGTGAWAPQPTHVEWLALLRHVVADLERALAHVAAHPVRGLALEPSLVRASRVKRVDAAVRSAVRRGAGRGAFAPLEGGLRVRERLEEPRARPTLDTPEHRWLARQLERIVGRLARLRREEATREPGARRDRTIEELAALERRVAGLTRLEPLAAATGDPPAGFASLGLLGAPGYREAYRACLVLSLGLRLEGGPVRLSLKDLALLYEYWCYLALLRIVSEETGHPVPVRDLFRVTERGLHVGLRKGNETAISFGAPGDRRVTVRYNPRFAGDAVLVPQRPDVVVTIEGPGWPGLHLLVDAKYRVDASAEYAARYGSAGPPEDAINVLHRYRDAILESESGRRPARAVVEAAAAFPLHAPAEYRDGALWRALERLGVGAIPVLPNDEAWLREWLRGALARGGWALADRAISHRATDRARELERAAAEPVLVGVLRGAAPAEHLAWVARKRRYYVPYSPTRPVQLAARWVALYSPAALRQPGAVTHAAPVEGVDVVERREVETPWPARRASRSFVALYRLGELVELARPIENRDGRRPSVVSWTSRLALERAREMAELALETEAEWRLVEALEARGTAYRVERPWIVAASGARARYAGAAGFVLVAASGHERMVASVDEAVARISTA